MEAASPLPVADARNLAVVNNNMSALKGLTALDECLIEGRSIHRDAGISVKSAPPREGQMPLLPPEKRMRAA